MSRDLPLLQAAGIVFKQEELLRLALTHASRAGKKNNQRLEFLGDRVLALVLADTIYALYPDENEGALALRHAALVQASTLAGIARTHELSAFISATLVGVKTPDDIVDNILADTLEALIGALYLDQGYAACQKLISVLWADAVRDMVTPPQDPKNALQEWAQARGKNLPVYTLLAQTGLAHAPVFEVRVSLENSLTANGTGPTRRMAEKDAARALLNLLDIRK